MVMPPAPQTESETKPVAVFWMSCFWQVSLPGVNEPLICLSVVASVQCCMVMSGIEPPVRTIFISHRPALRTGSSTARASATGHSASPHAAETYERSSRVMRGAPVWLEHDPDPKGRVSAKCEAVFRKDHAQTKSERDGYSKKSHLAQVMEDEFSTS